MKYVVIVTRWAAGHAFGDAFGPFDSERDAFLWLENNRPRTAVALVRPLREVGT